MEELEPREIVRRIGLPIAVTEDGHICPVCGEARQEAKRVGVHLRTHWIAAGVAFADIPSGKDRVKCPFCTHKTTRHGLCAHLVSTVHADRGFTLAEATGMARVLGFDFDAYIGRRNARAVNKRVADMTPEEHEAAKAVWREASERKRKGQTKPRPTGKWTGTYGSKVQCPFCPHTCLRKNLPGHLRSNRHGVERSEANRIAREAPALTEDTSTRHLPARVEVREQRRAAGVVVIDPTDAAIAVVQSQVNGHGVPGHLLADVIQYVDATRELAAKLREV